IILFADPVLDATQSTIAKDLRLNLKRILHESSLTAEEGHLALMALATAVEYGALKEFAVTMFEKLGFAEEQIREAAESSAIMAMLNTYYRFRYMVNKDQDYATAGLRMTSLARPALGKEKFEMLAFALSVLNGCQSCVRSHEEVLRNAGLTTDKIH